MQPDTIIPDYGNPQSLNRYAYVTNRPVNFSDPTGHKECDQGDGSCKRYTKIDLKNDLRISIKYRFNWNVADDFGIKELETIYQTGLDIEAYTDIQTGGNGSDWMQYAFGNITIVHRDCSNCISYTWPFIGESLGVEIQLSQNWLSHGWGANILLAHELGHAWDINSGFSHSGEMNKDLSGSSWCYFCPLNGAPEWNPKYHEGYGNSGSNEYFAEAFAATIYTPSDPSYIPSGASDWISWQISIDLINYLVPGARL